MIRKKGGLGRGLDALLGASAAARNEALPESAAGERLRQLPVEQIQRGRYQPRQDLREDTLQELAESIRAQGLVQPVIVRPLGGGRYELIAGERRWRAAQLAGLQEVPAVIREVSDQAAIAMALIENIQREDLNPLEEATALQRLIAEFDLTHQQAAEAVGRSRTAVTNLLRLLELTEEVQQRVRDRKLDMGHARALLTLPAALQREAAQQVLVRGLSVRETEELARRLQQAASVSPPAKPLDPNIRLLQDNLSERLGTRVRLQHGTSGKGCVVIHYNTLDELDGILSRVK
ncbi:MAG: ParB/RepB/Spo0J family partition protein [Candidatus Competibacteraceae bacterium]|uniref:Probable chromosome-partitioning protein ParB n=1 Tax=Candidatus Contendobacter odensis Run_B_J11 TaxID=1400861 RepID=A0A7U7GFM9_9GAMM|nr:ParB/RepB/Spo0J family partition protein [Candidatus Contendobacter odensis]MBK8536600.1 ParB/RepB/Spo0J family partition protein [Candidatus Competibacteraceae bacterium]MBK8753122.1 ParB/RepB/Spo0J family partition protein [Candidatus Competibacteraceae bacterium]CDH47534.1 chromosome partitioning protein [Candidatus Contendobacter odensis Run_B_J11]